MKCIVLIFSINFCLVYCDLSLDYIPSISLTKYNVSQLQYENYKQHFHIDNFKWDIFTNGSVNISESCQKQFNILLDANLVFRMLASWGQFPFSGMQYASSIELGLYDECMSIDYTQDNERVLGKYCPIGLVLLNIWDLLPDPTVMILTSPKLAICIPQACTANDLNQASPFFPLTFFFDNLCYTKEDGREFDAGVIATIVFVTIIVSLMIISTSYDVYLYMTEKKSPNPLLTSFSIYTNLKNLFRTTSSNRNKNNEQILCFNGMKCLSMMWIVAGHGVSGWQIMPTTYANAYSEWNNSGQSEYIYTAHFAVDSFFFMSGFLLAYQYFKTVSKTSVWKQVNNVPLNIIHRYLRITPPVVALYLFAVYLSKFIGSGPTFKMACKALVDPCKKYWWPFFLYIQNYYNPKELCFTPTWYVSADMQLFLVSLPLVILLAYIYEKNFNYAIFATLLLNIAFIILPLSLKLTESARERDPNVSYDYDGHSRLIDYFIGILYGMYIRHEKNNLIKTTKLMNAFGWILVVGAMYSVAHIVHETTLHGDYNAKIISTILSRPIWCLGLCWMVHSCLTGQAGIINWFLSSSIMQIGGKISYSLYLTHSATILLYFSQTRSKLHFSDFYLFYYFCGHLIMSILLATIWYLAFEVPFVIIEKVLLSRRWKCINEFRAFFVKIPCCSSAHPPKSVEKGS